MSNNTNWNTYNFNSLVPPAPVGKVNVVFQNDGGRPMTSISAFVATGTGSFFQEVVSVTVGATTGTLSNIPTYILGIYRNGLLMISDSAGTASPDYTISGATFTLFYAALAGDVFYAIYSY